MTSKLLSHLNSLNFLRRNPMDSMNFDGEGPRMATVEISIPSLNSLKEKAAVVDTVVDQNATLRTKIDEASDIIHKQKEAIMTLQSAQAEKAAKILPNVPIKIRDFQVSICGLPNDLTAEEASYISGILSAYASHPLDSLDLNEARHTSTPINNEYRQG